MSKTSWGTKRNCPSCAAVFYDLNKNPAVCPKCNNTFDPLVLAKTRKKTSKRSAGEESEIDLQPSILPSRKNNGKSQEMEDVGNDLMEIDEMDDIENLDELSEIDEMEEVTTNEDDADEEALIEELDTGDNNIMGSIEDEEAIAFGRETIDNSDNEDKKSRKKK